MPEKVSFSQTDVKSVISLLRKYLNMAFHTKNYKLNVFELFLSLNIDDWVKYKTSHKI